MLTKYLKCKFYTMIVDNYDILFYNLNEAREFQILRLLFYYFGFKPLWGSRNMYFASLR